MTRRRTLKGLEPQLIAAARSSLRGGLSPSETRAALEVQFPRASLIQIRNVVAREGPRQNLVELITRANKGQFVRMDTLANCPAGQGRVRVKLSVTVHSTRTGTDKRFDHTVDTRSSGRLRDILADAIGLVEREAVGFGYQIYNISPNQTAGSIRYELDYAECY